MPVIIEKADWPLWLGESKGDVIALMRPAPEDVLRVWPVDKRVGHPDALDWAVKRASKTLQLRPPRWWRGSRAIMAGHGSVGVRLGMSRSDEPHFYNESLKPTL
jgi:hypothetical protein